VQKPASKLSYKLQRELEELPLKIEQLEADIAQLTEQTQAANFFSQDRAVTEKVLQHCWQTQQKNLDACYARWTELENAEPEQQRVTDYRQRVAGAAFIGCRFTYAADYRTTVVARLRHHFCQCGCQAKRVQI
jgi:chromosome segregation ATPase